MTKIINTIKRERGGTLRHQTYKDRSTGKTEQWEVTKKLFSFTQSVSASMSATAATEPVLLP